MIKRIDTVVVLLAVVLLATACSKVPSAVVQPDEMALILADMHTAESVMELNRTVYLTDSSKQAFRQSVYLRHGVTSEQVDSSLAWYGRNITYYMDVYDKTIEILERRLIESGNRVAAEAALSVAGDSVDVWQGARYIDVNDRLPSKLIAFSYSRDPNWERGDSYTWRAKFFNNTEGRQCVMVAEYADGSVEMLTQQLAGDGWKEISLFTDSTADATRVYGFIEAPNRPGTSMRLDSVEMVRKRVNPTAYSRRYMMRRLRTKFNPVEISADAAPSDSVAVESTPDESASD